MRNNWKWKGMKGLIKCRKKSKSNNESKHRCSIHVFHYMKEKGLVSSSVTSKESVSDLPANHACLCFLPSTWILERNKWSSFYERWRSKRGSFLEKCRPTPHCRREATWAASVSEMFKWMCNSVFKCLINCFMRRQVQNFATQFFSRW